MYTTITIRHETAEALKATELWRQIEDLLFADGVVSVVEIGPAETVPGCETDSIGEGADQ